MNQAPLPPTRTNQIDRPERESALSQTALLCVQLSCLLCDHDCTPGLVELVKSSLAILYIAGCRLSLEHTMHTIVWNTFISGLIVGDSILRSSTTPKH